MGNMVRNLAERTVLLFQLLLQYSDREHILDVSDYKLLINRLDLPLADVGREAWYKSRDILDYNFDYVVKEDDVGTYVDRPWNISESLMFKDNIEKSRIIGTEKKKSLKQMWLETAGPSAVENDRADYVVTVNKHKNMEAVELYVEVVRTAIYEKTKIRFQYVDFNHRFEYVVRHGEDYYYVFNPLMVEFDRDTCYVYGIDDATGKHKSFRVDRMINVEKMKQHRCDPTSCYGSDWKRQLEEKIKKTHNHFGTEPVRLKLDVLCCPEALKILYDMAGETIFIVSQLIDNHETVIIDTMRGPTLTNWLIAYAKYFTVLEPECVLEDIKEHLQGACEKYMR